MKAHVQNRNIPAHTRSLSKDLQIVLLHQTPVREQAQAECLREMAKLERLQATWHHFENVNRPAFEAWMAATFAPILTRIRENITLIRTHQALIQKVYSRVFWGETRSYRKAYAAILAEMAKGAPGVASRGKDSTDDASAPGPPPSPEPQPAGGRAPDSPGKTLRTKEIYRLLVRRLHPDTQTERNPRVMSLWHDVQAAYESHDLERLEMLLTLTDFVSDSSQAQAGLGEIRSLTAQLRNAVQELACNLQDARNDPAWGFDTRKDLSTYAEELDREFQHDLAAQEHTLTKTVRILQSWSPLHPPKPNHSR